MGQHVLLNPVEYPPTSTKYVESQGYKHLLKVEMSSSLEIYPYLEIPPHIPLYLRIKSNPQIFKLMAQIGLLNHTAARLIINHLACTIPIYSICRTRHNTPFIIY